MLLMAEALFLFCGEEEKGKEDEEEEGGGFKNPFVHPVVAPPRGTLRVVGSPESDLAAAPPADGSTVVFDGTLAFSAETVAKMADQVNANKGKLEFLSSTGPLWLGIGGGVLIIVSIVLLARRPRPALCHSAASTLP